MCRKHFTCHITINITRSVPQSPCLTCGYHKECAKNISLATSPSTSRKMTPGHDKWLVAMADDFTTFICPTGNHSGKKVERGIERYMLANKKDILVKLAVVYSKTGESDSNSSDHEKQPAKKVVVFVSY